MIRAWAESVLLLLFGAAFFAIPIAAIWGGLAPALLAAGLWLGFGAAFCWLVLRPTPEEEARRRAGLLR